MHKTKDNIRIKIVAPLVIMFLILGVILVFGGYKIDNQHSKAEIKSKTAIVDKSFSRFLNHQSSFLAVQLQYIANDPSFINAWQSRNRKELNDKASKVFKRINNDFGVTHFYFIEPDKTCFLRVHSPEKFGDEITRFTLQEATDTTRVSSGIELGPLGTFTLRVVYPWIDNGRLLGYLELGEEIEHLTPRLKEISGLDLVFTINKSNLVRKDWEMGRQLLEKKGNWDEFSEFVIIDKTIDSLPAEIKNILRQKNSLTSSLNISLKDRFLSVYSHPLRDVSGREIGTILAIYDTTRIIKQTRKSIMLFAMAILITFLIILLFYYRYAGLIEKQIFVYRNNLEGLVRERTRELDLARDEVKVLSGFLPICASCKQIRDDKGYWTQIEAYISDHSDAEFTHSICPKCAKKLYPNVSLS